MSVYRDIFKHSSIYAAGIALTRVASVLLLPFYTRFLTPADYGIIALVDLTSAIVSHMAAGGIHVAVMRHHFEPRFKEDRHPLWTTGLLMLGLVAVPQILTVWFLRAPIAELAFGPEITDGPEYLALAVWALPARLFATYSQAYLRAEKRSMLFVGVTVPGLLIRIALNVYFIGFLGYGVFGFLWGSLIGTWLESLAYFVILFLRTPFRIVRDVVGPMWHYGWPLIITTLAGLAMHQMNRYLLRWLMADLGPIGIFAVAYTLAQGVNQMVVVPFQSIWAAVMYEIDLLDDRVEMFQRVFKFYALGIALVLLAVSLLAIPIVRILAAPEFGEAAHVLPWLCLAFFFFTLHSLLRVPAMIHRMTISVARTSLIAATVSFLANCALIPHYGIYGAAYASVLTYLVFSGLGHLAYRQIEDLRLPLRYVALAAVVGTGLVWIKRSLVPEDASLLVQIAVGTGIWLGAAAGTLLGPARGLIEKDSPVWGMIRRARSGKSGPRQAGA